MADSQFIGNMPVGGANPGSSGGSGTVTSVSGTAPISVATGTTTPVISFLVPQSRYNARGVVTANVGTLSSFTVASNDGLTYSAGQTVLLVGQTSAGTNGPYTVGTVGGGTAPLTRPSWWAAGDTMTQGAEFIVSEGTLYGNSTWRSTATATVTVDTTNPVFYPKFLCVAATLVAGTITIGSSQGLWILNTSTTMVNFNVRTAAASSLTTRYTAPNASRTAGVVGTASLVIQAETATPGAVNTSDTSTLDVIVMNIG